MPRLSLFILLTLALLCSCTAVIPNAEVCADKGALGAKCAFTRSGVEQSKKKVQWDRERVGWFCMDAKNYGKYQKFISDVCAQSQNCVDEVQKFVGKLQAPGGAK